MIQQLTITSLLALSLYCHAEAKDKSLDVYLVDVEGGAATLIITPAGESLLIDSGNPNDRDPLRILKVAEKVGLKRIDHHIITHWHRDHFGGTQTLATQLPIGRFYDHGQSIEMTETEFADTFDWYLTLSRDKRVVLKPGQRLGMNQAPDSPKLTITCVSSGGNTATTSASASNKQCDHHQPRARDVSDNRESVGVLLKFGEFEFLDLGDLTWNVEHDLVCPHNVLGKVDVYQTNHHGLSTSNNPVLIHSVAPKVVLMNNGARKGGELPVMKALKNSPGLEAVFQVHKNVRIDANDNAPLDHIANVEEDCEGEYLHLSVASNGKSYQVQVGSKGKAFRFTTKSE